MLTFTVLPTVFLLGCFTIVRLVDTTAQNIVALQRVEQIRQYWATLNSDGARFFPEDVAAGSRGVRYGALTTLFTTATMIAVVNAVLGGAIASIVLIAAGTTLGLATGAGVAIGVILVVAALQYQRVRLRALNRPR